MYEDNFDPFLSTPNEVLGWGYGVAPDVNPSVIFVSGAESNVYRCQILTSKVDPRTEIIIKLIIIALDIDIDRAN